MLVAANEVCTVKMARRAIVGEILQVFCDNLGYIRMCPLGVTPDVCTVYLVDGDEVCIDNISSSLARQYHLGIQEYAYVIGIDRVIFHRNTCIGNVKLSRLAGVIITPTHLAENKLALYQKHDDLIFEEDRC